MEEHKKKKSIVHSEAFPGILLVIATVVALILANTPLDRYYEYILKDINYYKNLVDINYNNRVVYFTWR